MTQLPLGTFLCQAITRHHLVVPNIQLMSRSCRTGSDRIECPGWLPLHCTGLWCVILNNRTVLYFQVLNWNVLPHVLQAAIVLTGYRLAKPPPASAVVTV
jgi:hypothetical protein